MTSPVENAVETADLRKVYRGQGGAPAKEALKGISLAIPRGSIFGLLGPNGAGKSTFINILAGLVIKTGGKARIWGFDIDEHPRQSRASIGVVPQELNIDPFFTPLETLEIQAGLYGVPKAERRSVQILEAMGLADKKDAYARTLSGGMRRRLLVAKALVHTPPVLVLDEPTAGVDIELRKGLWDYVRSLNARGMTIVLTTHYLEEAEQLCDRIAIVHHGEVVACDTTAALLARIDEKTLLVTPDRPLTALPEALRRAGKGRIDLRPDGRLAMAYSRAETRIDDLLEQVRAANIGIADLSTEESDLEDIFLQLTGSGAGTRKAGARPGEAAGETQGGGPGGVAIPAAFD